MCGIVGFINRKNVISTTADIFSMLQIQKHRGPDDSGICAFSFKNSDFQHQQTIEPAAVTGDFEGVIGFNRLSILDLSHNGHQPMISRDGKSILAFNGEIYNAFDYRNELIKWGYQFKSTTDTEIVLALYEKYGLTEMLGKLNGMFAIVIADLANQKLYVARDRFGIKPMYYIFNNDIFAFSSELKSFRYIDGFKFKLDDTQLDEYLLFRNTLNGTLLKDVNNLSAGTFLTYTIPHNIEHKEFFNINDSIRKTEKSVSFEEHETKMEEMLAQSVKRQLMSDVKLGCQLSGGIDSTLVTYLANKNSKKGLFESVSVVVDNEQYSEEKYIDIVSKKLKIQSHKFLLDADYYLNTFEKATWHLESPLNHPNTIGIYYLSQEAKKYVTVLLSGEGADEVFGGYKRFYDVCKPYRPYKLLYEFRKKLQQPVDFLSYMDPVFRAVMATCYMNPSIASELRPGFNLTKSTKNRFDLFNGLTGSTFDKQIKYEILTYLPDLLLRQDKMSMAHSIENRVPFLDNEIVDASFHIPRKFLLGSKSLKKINTEKYLLKTITAGIFGDDFAFRNKMGFGIPLKVFLANPRFKEYFYDKIISGTKKRGILNNKKIENWLNNISSIEYHEMESLWIAISFEIWASIYLDNNYENWNSYQRGI